jgi:hypothetical protein
MIVTLYTFVKMYDHALAGLDHLLDKGVEFAAANGISEADMLGWRLIGDMHPLAFQAMVVINFARAWPARAAGLPIPDPVSPDLDVAGLKAAIAEAKAYLAALTPEQFAGRDEVPITYQVGPGMELTLPAGRWLSVFATTNLYFHLSTAYGILRANGVQIGKADMFGGGL